MFIVYVDIKKCTCCGKCVVICPEIVFQYCQEGKTDPCRSGSCTAGCMSCVGVCTEKCIEVREL